MTSDDADEAAIDSLVAPTPFAGAIAVSYLRVSTKEQAEKGGNAEGFSIPAQREANQRKADQLGATIVEEFVDAGESARKADRPELMRMIKYVATHKTSYCIVHKVDRLARNRADDVTIHLALKDAGVTLVSATENIDETPSGMLLHGIMSSIAEFYSRNLATEVVKGLSQKAAQGGTVTKAPIGYRNVGIRDDMGREIRTVEVDEERAGLVRWAFQVFASGDWTTSQLHQELVARGLTTSPTPRRPSKPIAKSTVHRMLTNPYYKDVIVYQGATYRGAHDPIVPVEVWEQVQIVLGTHTSAADATQIHDHYLKGSVFCGQCGSRLIVCNAKSSQGTIYPYFVCSSCHAGRNDCTRQAMLIEDVERLIERFYTRVQIPSETRQALSGMIHAKFDQMMSEGAAELAELATRRTELEGEQTKLLQAHYAGAIPLDLLKREQDRITASLETIDFRVRAHTGEYADARANLDDSLLLLANIADIYANADDANRRLCNQALFKAIYVDEDNDIHVGYRTPYDGLSNPDLQADALTWADQARAAATGAETTGTRKKGQAGTSSKGGPLVESSNLTHLGCLRSTFGNFSPKANTLVRRLNRGLYRVCNRPQKTAPMDHRGPVVRTVGMAQTFLTPAEVDQLVGDYEAGSGVQELASKYGVHRATVFAHLQRREVPRRRPGLSEPEQAEALRLSREGMSMRAIGRQMGVDRKAVRAALVEAGIVLDEAACPA